MRAIYLNENDVLPHIGCKAVANAHQLLFERLGINVVQTFYKNDLWAYKQYPTHQQRVEALSHRYGQLLQSVDALIINGEGTLHHGRGEDLLAMLEAASNFGVKAYLINALIQEMGGYGDVLAKCTAIVTRDPRSYTEAKEYCDQVFLVPDSFVLADFEQSTEYPAPNNVVVTDFLGTMPDGPGYIIDRLLKERDLDCTYFPFQSPFTSSQWRSVVARLQSARCVVSARHHGLYAAAMAGRPMVILESNSHKMAAFREMYGDFIPVVASYDQLETAIEDACAAEDRFRELPQLILEKNVWETYASVFGRPLIELSEDRIAQISASPFGAGINSTATRSAVPHGAGPTLRDRVIRKSRRVLRLGSGNTPLKVGQGPVSFEGKRPEWLLNYWSDLADAKRRRDPRLLPLRGALTALATEQGTFRKHREFWDKVFRLGRSRTFLDDELAGLLSNVQDPELLSRIATLASRASPDAAYYGISLAIVQRQVSNPTPRFKIIIEHLRNAIRADSPGESAVLLEDCGQLSVKQQSLVLNAVIPVFSESQNFREITALPAFFPDAEIKENNSLKVAEAFFMMGRYETAKRWLSAVKEQPSLKLTADHRLGRLLVHQGEFQAGWPLMNRVVDREHFTSVAAQLGLPMWVPEMENVSCLVVWFHELGGIGGEILWGQLLRQFQSQVNCRLRLVVDPRLQVLFRESFPDCEIVSRSEKYGEISDGADAFVFGRELTKFVVKEESDFGKVAAHYFTLPPVAPLGLDSLNGKHVAISWKTTNPASAMYRNVPLQSFAKLLSEFDCHYHCLQHGDISEDIQILRSALGDKLHTETFDPSASVEDIGGRVMQMDGVITIDNTTLHIAGALGVSTLALISIPAYWQWPSEGTWSRWYESVKLVRQDAPGHWLSVFEGLRKQLEDLLSSDTASHG